MDFFSLKDTISTFVFGLQPAIQTIVVHETEEIGNKRRSFENLIQKARKESEAFCARLTKLAINWSAFYVSLRSDQDKNHAFMMYQKKNAHAYHGSKKQVMPPP